MWAGSSTGYGADFSLHPTHYIPVYNGSVPWEERVDTVIRWMTNDTHPANMVFLYYDEPDSAGHSFGTDDPRTIEIIKQSDDRAGQLVQKLKNAGIYDDVSRKNAIICQIHVLHKLFIV
jgi:predicted AlkP superfamily pyrophosphatase or phosphodiesterase